MSERSPDPFEIVLADLLVPLARAMVSRGVTLGLATESMKHALLKAAVEIEGTGVSDSRISVMTGLHRKDVRRLRSDLPDPAGRKTVNRMVALIGHWASAPEFLDSTGAPRPLPRQADERGPGFNDLVRRVRLDVAPGTILQALADQGAVTEDAGGLLHLRQNALLPTAGSEELVAAYRATLATHLSAATHNLVADPQGARHFDRVVRYSHLSDASVAELDALARTEAQALLERLNRRAQELQRQDADAGCKGKFAAGAYVLPTHGTDKEDPE